MDNTKLNLRTPEEAEKVFYETFLHCDATTMAALWADNDVVCIHPGSGAIVGHDAVMRSWQQIFTNALPPQITFTTTKQIVSGDLAISLVVEEVSTDGGNTAVVLATNVYQKFECGWLMVEHHGSLVQTRPQRHTLQ